MKNGRSGIGMWLLQRLAAAVLAVVCTLALFLILPVMQTIGHPRARDLTVRNVDVMALEPPPPPPIEEQIEEERPPEKPPRLAEEAPPLDLSQLELALNPTVGDDLFADFQVALFDQLGQEGGSEELDRIFSLGELDQRPRVLFQRMPVYPPELQRKNRQGTVYVTFLVDRQGRVVGPKVEKSTDPAFEDAALEAVRQWKFEPGTRKGEKVQFKLRVPITFNASG
jgi:protein TonB